MKTRTILRAIGSRHSQPSHRRITSAALAKGRQVNIVEVGPRDGLQNEKATISLDTKLELIRRLATTGLQTIEAGSFVSPKWVPQMANSAEILEALLASPPQSAKPVKYQWLLPNPKGLDNYTAVFSTGSSTGTLESENPNDASSSENGEEPRTDHEVSIFLAATESFSHKNINCSIDDSLNTARQLITQARTRGHAVRAYISVALGCPYEGDVPPQRVASMATSLLEMGAAQIAVADTTGMGTAPSTAALLDALAAAGVLMPDLALHLHDTYRQALVNVLVALDKGVRTFDSAVGGLGGCPFAAGATGNVATEDLVYFLHTLGMETGVDVEAVARIGGWISAALNKENASGVGKALLARALKT